MGTRADFYIGKGKDAEWLGSIAWSGHPSDIPDVILEAKSPEDYRRVVIDILKGRRDATVPEQGWPWPWEDSQATDYAYAFFDGKVLASRFGCSWFDPMQPKPELAGDKVVEFPDMSARQAVARGERSGLIMVRG